MTVKTEGQHKGEFLVSEANGTLSREVGTLSSGQVVTDGQVLKLSGGELQASVGNAGAEVLVGIVLGNHDASAADKPNVPYIARLAEVDASLVTVDATDPEPDAAVWTELKALNIVAR
jgi:hypothetical protein